MGAVGVGARFTRPLEDAPNPGHKAGATAVRMAHVAGIVGVGRGMLLPYGSVGSTLCVGGSPLVLRPGNLQFKG